MRLRDTSPDIAAMQEAAISVMSEEQRAELMTGLTLAVQQLAFAGVQARFPDASDDEIWLRLAVNRLGADVVRKVYGFLPDGP